MAMTIRKSLPIGAVLLIGTGFAADAQPQYQPAPQFRESPYGPPGGSSAPAAPPQYSRYRYAPSRPAAGLPPSWSYNPYTNGTVPPPNAGGGP